MNGSFGVVMRPRQVNFIADWFESQSAWAKRLLSPEAVILIDGNALNLTAALGSQPATRVGDPKPSLAAAN